MYTAEQELAEARNQLELALRKYEEATDKRLIDAACYEIMAATNRIDAAILRAKRERRSA